MKIPTTITMEIVANSGRRCVPARWSWRPSCQSLPPGMDFWTQQVGILPAKYGDFEWEWEFFVGEVTTNP
jgi:hypothetical protein